MQNNRKFNWGEVGEGVAASFLCFVYFNADVRMME